MARMIPDHLRPDTKSHAERQLYNAFREQLGDEFTVFHQVAWQVRDPRSGAEDGEADFVIAHPALGILMLEVKGGKVQYDGMKAQWRSGPHKIDDPFAQARSSMYNLLKLLKDEGYWSKDWVTMGHAVAFPDYPISQERLKPDAPRSIILDATQLKNLREWVDAVLTYWRGQDKDKGAPGAARIEALERFLSPH